MAAANVEIRVLGAIEVRREAHPIDLGGTKQRAVLAALLAAPGRSAPVGALIDAVWKGSPPASARHAITVYVSELRRALGEQRITLTAACYSLQLPRECVDTDSFEALVEQGRRQLADGRLAEAALCMQTALALWRGPAFGEFADEEFARPEAARLDELRVAAIESRIEAELELGRHQALLPELQQLVRQLPESETLLASLMLALYRAGRQADALAAFARSRSYLADTFGIEPGPQLQSLYRRILNHDGTLELPAGRRNPGFLPAPVSSFVDREEELRAVTDLIGRPGVRLVTLTGPPGIGKTRLALGAAESLAADFEAGAWFVDLAPVTKPDQIEPAISQVLDRTRSITATIGECQVLLLLDNFEHLLEGASLISKLLLHCPNLTVLVTSRERLRLSGEHVFSVPPLGPAEANALFSERAQAVNPSFRGGGQIGAICAHLDGLPLAIELAAGHTDTLTADELLTQLARRLTALIDGARDLPPRQQTLRAAIAWSHELLDVPEQVAFARLGVFEGGWTDSDAQPVTGVSAAVLDSLVERNLIRRDGEHFVMLDTIREYALERLAEHGELDETQAAHASHFAAVAEDLHHRLLSGPVTDDKLLISHRPDNFRTALNWLRLRGEHERHLRAAAALSEFWYLTGRLAEGRTELEHAIAQPGNEASPAYADAVEGCVGICFGQCDRARGTELAAVSLQLFRERGDTLGIARALNTAGLLALEEPERARGLFLESAAAAAAAGSSWLGSWAAGNLVYVELLEGRYERAAELLREWRDLSDPPGAYAGALDAAMDARIAIAQGRLDDARAALEGARSHMTRSVFEPTRWEIVILEAHVALAHGEPAAAARLLGAAWAGFETTEFRFVDDPLLGRWFSEAELAARAALGDGPFEATFAGGLELADDELCFAPGPT